MTKVASPSYMVAVQIYFSGLATICSTHIWMFVAHPCVVSSFFVLHRCSNSDVERVVATCIMLITVCLSEHVSVSRECGSTGNLSFSVGSLSAVGLISAHCVFHIWLTATGIACQTLLLWARGHNRPDVSVNDWVIKEMSAAVSHFAQPGEKAYSCAAVTYQGSGREDSTCAALVNTFIAKIS